MASTCVCALLAQDMDTFPAVHLRDIHWLLCVGTACLERRSDRVALGKIFTSAAKPINPCNYESFHPTRRARSSADAPVSTRLQPRRATALNRGFTLDLTSRVRRGYSDVFSATPPQAVTFRS